MTETNVLHCANHPGVETTLRCNRCDKPICPKCAVKSPVGYRCRECVKSQLKIFDTAVLQDYPLGFIVAGFLSLIASFLISLIGGIGFIGWFLIIIGAPTAGMVIAEGTRYVIQRHRSRSLFITISVAVALGALPMALTNLFIGNLFGLLFQGVYLVLVVPSVYTRLSGIQLFK